MAWAGMGWMGVCMLVATLALSQANSSTYENDFPLSADYVGTHHVVVSWAGDAGTYTVNIKKGEGDRPTEHPCTKDLTCSGGTCTFNSKDKTTECDNLGSCRNIVVEAVGPSGTSQPLKLTTGPSNKGHNMDVKLNNSKMTVAWIVATSGEYNPCTTSTTATITTPHNTYTYTNDSLPPGEDVLVTHEQTMGPCDKGTATVLVEIRGGDGVADYQEPVITGNYDVTTVTSPGPPQNVVVAAVVNKPDQLEVTWTKYNLPCTVIHRVTWSHSGTEIGSGTGSDSSQYTITGLSAYTQYEVCVQAKVDGSDLSAPTCNTGTTDEDIPGPPVNVEVTNAQDTELTVSWDPPDTPNGVVTNYRVIWHYDGGASANHDTVDTTYTIRDLNSCTPYTISVTAATSKGWGSATSVVTHETAAGVPSAPSSVKAVMVLDHSDELSVTWVAGVSPDPSCTVSHTVSWSQDGSLVDTADAIEPDQYTITGLKASTTYLVCVTAWTTPGNHSKEVCTNAHTDEDIPESPVNVRVHDTQDTQFTVSWDPPTTPNGVITKYRVFWHYDGGGSANHDTVDTTYTIRDLKPCTPYTISVAAATSKGWGSATSGVTHNTAAGAPAELSCSVGADGNMISLDWKKPDTQCDVNRYHVSYVGEVLWSDELHKGEADTSGIYYDLDGLLPWTQYNVCIAAIVTGVTGDVVGHDSCCSQTTDEAAPGQPSSAHVNSSSSTSLKVAWATPADANGNITGYQVRCSDGGEAETPGTSFTCSDLQPDMSYIISIQAHNGAGLGMAAVVDGHTKDNNVNVGAIVGGVIGALAGIGVMVFAVYMGRHRIRNTLKPSHQQCSNNPSKNSANIEHHQINTMTTNQHSKDVDVMYKNEGYYPDLIYG